MKEPSLEEIWTISNIAECSTPATFANEHTSSNGIFTFNVQLYDDAEIRVSISCTPLDGKVFAPIEPKCFIVKENGERCFAFGNVLDFLAF